LPFVVSSGPMSDQRQYTWNPLVDSKPLEQRPTHHILQLGEQDRMSTIART
jgi:hypothetical protein